ncbi:hypothetical protein CASFOL_036215 [Castilleja foliolosa]|uniref:Uncharacterized protein n=1 Tax=Castilleja foliolosa TaxID=1961234 RepID=A0ABD3BVR6_9LAMI
MSTREFLRFDYVGDQVTADNFYAVILGNKTAVSEGSRKVVDSGPNDHISIYYSDHGAAGIIGMPKGPYVTAKDLTDVLKKKHASRTYKSLACDAGSMFDGLLPEGLNIYATTASNAAELSWVVYCDFKEFNGTCLGDTYSVSWMEDSARLKLGTRLLHLTLKPDGQIAVNNVSEVISTTEMQSTSLTAPTPTFSTTTPAPKAGVSKRPATETPGTDRKMKRV